MKRMVMTAGLTLVLVTGGVTVASACGHGMRIDLEERQDTGLLVKAERATRKGQYKQAIRYVKRVFPNVAVAAKASPTARSAKLPLFPGARGRLGRRGDLYDRAQRVVASVAVRTDGAYGPTLKRTKGAKARSGNVSWAVETLQAQLKRRPHDSFLKTRLGEGLALLGQDDAALKVLGALAQSDLMADAHGYAALAKVHHRSGDAAGRDLAVDRCEKMSRDKKMCRKVSAGGRVG